MPGTVSIVDVELGPVERAAGVVYISDAQLDEGPLRSGDNLVLRDEGGCRSDAIVESVEPGSYGNRYRIKFSAHR